MPGKSPVSTLGPHEHHFPRAKPIVLKYHNLDRTTRILARLFHTRADCEVAKR
jgi:hypothetical protein